MAFRFGTKSLERLNTVHPDLQRVMRRALELSEIDFSITQGKRTLKEQQDLYAKGRNQKELDAAGLHHIAPAPGPVVTWSLKSNHLTGKAVDVGAYPHGALSWNEKFYGVIAKAVRKASQELKIPVVWGAVWDKRIDQIGFADLYAAAMDYKKRYESVNKGKKAKMDFPHFELARDAYPEA